MQMAERKNRKRRACEGIIIGIRKEIIKKKEDIRRKEGKMKFEVKTKER